MIDPDKVNHVASEQDYQRALERIDALMGRSDGATRSSRDQELDQLMQAVLRYEAQGALEGREEHQAFVSWSPTFAEADPGTSYASETTDAGELY